MTSSRSNPVFLDAILLNIGDMWARRPMDTTSRYFFWKSKKQSNYSTAFILTLNMTKAIKT